MSRDEVKRILAFIIASYPTFHPNDMAMTVEAWSTIFQEYDFNEIYIATKSFVTTDTSGFAPSIGQIIAKHQEMTKPKQMGELEAWGLVRNAISDGAYHYQERFDELPPSIQEAIGNPMQIHIWAIDSEYNEGVIQSNFIRAYRKVAERKKEFDRLPGSIQSLISATAQKFIGEKQWD